jgi:hypothetical protein
MYLASIVGGSDTSNCQPSIRRQNSTDPVAMKPGAVTVNTP